MLDADLGLDARNLIQRSYDMGGRVLAESDFQSSYSYTFDALDRLVRARAHHFTNIGDVTLTNGGSKQRPRWNGQNAYLTAF